MKTDDDFLKKIPVCWRGMFQCIMNSSGYNVNSMTEWYKDQTSSNYGGVLDWADLLQCLSVEEPACIGGNLVFVTRFGQLPTYIQQSLLSFLLQHRQSIPKSSLKSFADIMGPHTQSDSWIGILYRMIVAFIQDNPDVGTQNSPNVRTQLEEHYVFTQENKQKAETLTEKLRNTQMYYSPWNITTQKTIDHCQKSTSATSVGDMHIIPVEEMEQGTRNNDPRVISPDIIMIDDEEPPFKVQKLEPEITQSQIKKSPLASTAEEDTQTVIETESVEKLKALKEKWENGDTDVDEDDIILTSSTSMLKSLCEEIDLSDMSEAAIATACNYLNHGGKMISHSNCSVLLSALLLQKFKQMNQSASRILTGVVSSVAESFAKPLVEAVFVPTIKSPLMSTFQADLIVKVCKDVFNNTARIYFLEHIFRGQTEFTDNLMAVLQTIFESKLDVENSLLLTILESFKDQGSKLEKSLKFGKLVLALITKYGTQMNTEHKEMLSQILMSHKSFLKKSMQAAVNKL